MLTVRMALVVTAIAAFLVRRWLMVPLSSITAAVRRIRAGEDAELTPQGPPELRQVATAVDEMQRTIRQQRDDAIRAREAIEQSAILAVQVRSELTERPRRLSGRLDHGRGPSPRRGRRCGRLLRRLTDLADHDRDRSSSTSRVTARRARSQRSSARSS